MVQLVEDKLQESSIEQYKNEERAILAKRIHSAENRIKRLLKIMNDDVIAPEKHVKQLKLELYQYTRDLNFKKAKSMGNLLNATFEFITRNYKNITIFNSDLKQ